MTPKTFLIGSLVINGILIISIFFRNNIIFDFDYYTYGNVGGFVDGINFKESTNPKEIINIFIYYKDNYDYYFYNKYYLYSNWIFGTKTLQGGELKKLNIDYRGYDDISLYDETYKFSISTLKGIHIEGEIKENGNKFRLVNSGFF